MSSQKSRTGTLILATLIATETLSGTLLSTPGNEYSLFLSRNRGILKEKAMFFSILQFFVALSLTVARPIVSGFSTPEIKLTETRSTL